MNCPRCGVNNPEENRFCSSCGNQLVQPATMPEGLAPPPSEKKGKPAWWWVMVSCSGCLGFLIIIAIVLWAGLVPVFQKIKKQAISQNPEPCQSNLKQLAVGMLMYVHDYDERFPPTTRWSDVIYPYIRNEEILKCPAAPGLPGYAMNANLNLFQLKNIVAPASCVLLFDSTKGIRNAADAGKSIAWRHNNGGNCAFVDGHVKWTAAGTQLNFDPKSYRSVP